MKSFFNIRAIKADNTKQIKAAQRADSASAAMFIPTKLINLPDDELLEPIPFEVLHDGANQGLLFGAFVKQGLFRKRLAGFAVCGSHTSKGEADLYLHQLSVDPKYGRRGIGRALVQHVIDFAETQNYAQVSLSTFRDLVFNGPFYRSCGFVELAETEHENWMKETRQREGETMDISLRCMMVKRLVE